MKKNKIILKISAISVMFFFAFAFVVYATSSYTIGSLAITSSYNSYPGSTYSYTDANAYATYDVSRISVGNAGYTKHSTTLERSTGGYWVGQGTKTTTLQNANLSARVTWNDIVAGTFRYHVVGSTGTTYATLIVGSY